MRGVTPEHIELADRLDALIAELVEAKKAGLGAKNVSAVEMAWEVGMDVAMAELAKKRLQLGQGTVAPSDLQEKLKELGAIAKTLMMMQRTVGMSERKVAAALEG